jgi:uncharacterized protein involved in cysteine biosynthesis
MTREKETVSKLAIIWGDTVSLKDLLIAMLIGVVLGISFFKIALFLIQTQISQLPPNLHNSVALLAGIIGCLLAAVISAKLFAPKRTLSEEEFSPLDRERVLQELQVDMEAEAEEIKRQPAAVTREMEELQLLDVFRKSSETKRS